MTHNLSGGISQLLFFLKNVNHLLFQEEMLLFTFGISPIYHPYPGL